MDDVLHALHAMGFDDGISGEAVKILDTGVSPEEAQALAVQLKSNESNELKCVNPTTLAFDLLVIVGQQRTQKLEQERQEERKRHEQEKQKLREQLVSTGGENWYVLN